MNVSHGTQTTAHGLHGPPLWGQPRRMARHVIWQPGSGLNYYTISFLDGHVCISMYSIQKIKLTCFGTETAEEVYLNLLEIILIKVYLSRTLAARRLKPPTSRNLLSVFFTKVTEILS